ncbi:hypothetical protein GCM10009677_37360 [Sphaerisporangium rubeum]|uniref:Uncharacterized protein n=1 Tax=Sphaerisporangium rubeum TaxID=321317 RepID=A0A7X0M9M6_9ACTN|nr:DUF6232 family protein [Sphaerisporangium rubeum]MBB6475204.1 hypothetical protein [Sphaerisporangium rubeum]
MVVQVRISEGVLWVGGEAYPLRNIAHVGQRVLEVNKGAAWKRFSIRVLITLLAGLILSAFSDTLALIVILGVTALLIWRLVTVLNQPPLHGLVINTSGTQRDAVWSTAASEVAHLVHEITKAIGHPDSAQMVINVAHAVQGDYIQQYGSGSIGKARHDGSGDILAGK